MDIIWEFIADKIIGLISLGQHFSLKYS